VREAVLDASVLLGWFSPAHGSGGSVGIRTEFEQGKLAVIAPPIIHLDVLNVAGRRWGWDVDSLLQLAAALDDLPFELVEPELPAVARWVGAGLTAYHAAYVSVAESSGISLLTEDAVILRLAGDIARSPG
jgi:predicted nucleic acid-binding protein